MKKSLIVSDQVIVNKIHYLRGQKVMLSRDLAELYGVTAKRLHEQVKRNRERFPDRYMFVLTKSEHYSLRSQFATFKKGQHPKYLPYAFTEHGVMQLANVLKSERAILMSIRIIDIFIQMREVLFDNKDILLKLEHLEKKMMTHHEKMNKHDEEIQLIFSYVKKLLSPSRSIRKKLDTEFKVSI